MFIRYSYQRVGQPLFRSLAEKLSTGHSVVLLAHRFGGKRYTVRQVEKILRGMQDAGEVVSLPLNREMQTMEDLGARPLLAGSRRNL